MVQKVEKGYPRRQREQIYRKAGAGKPWAGHNIEKVLSLGMFMGRVSIEDNLGDVEEIGSE